MVVADDDKYIEIKSKVKLAILISGKEKIFKNRSISC